MNNEKPTIPAAEVEELLIRWGQRFDELYPKAGEKGAAKKVAMANVLGRCRNELAALVGEGPVVEERTTVRASEVKVGNWIEVWGDVHLVMAIHPGPYSGELYLAFHGSRYQRRYYTDDEIVHITRRHQ